MSRFEQRLSAFFYRPDEDVTGLLDLGEPATAAPAPPVEAPGEFLAFALGAERFLLPLAAVREVVKPPALTEVPREGPALRGLMSLRGELMPVYDVRERLGLGPPPPAGPAEGPQERAARVLVLHGGAQGPAGVLADAVVGVVRLRPSALEVPQAGVVRSERHGVRALGRVRDALYALLDAEALLA
jgi:purine-binding chemotaxis protein CheW